jgi:hypothetical protein
LIEQSSHPPLGRLLIEAGAIDEQQLAEALALQRARGGRLGEILSPGLVSRFCLAAALARQRKAARLNPASTAKQNTRQAWTPLGQILVDRHLISPVQLKQALAEQRLRTIFLGQILLERSWITATELVHALADQLEQKLSQQARFEVQELNTGQWKTLHVGESFDEASDFTFEQVLTKRDPHRLQIIRAGPVTRELVWSYQSTA